MNSSAIYDYYYPQRSSYPSPPMENEQLTTAVDLPPLSSSTPFYYSSGHSNDGCVLASLHTDSNEPKAETLNPKRCNRTRLTSEQVEQLELVFARSRYPDLTTMKELVKTMDIPMKRLSVWFQNKRQRLKKREKQLETARLPITVIATPCNNSNNNADYTTAAAAATNNGLLAIASSFYQQQQPVSTACKYEPQIAPANIVYRYSAATSNNNNYLQNAQSFYYSAANAYAAACCSYTRSTFQH